MASRMLVFSPGARFAGTVAIEEDYVNGSEKKYGPDGFMYYLYELDDYATNDQGTRKVASLKVVRKA
mgnify:FL=1